MSTTTPSKTAEDEQSSVKHEILNRLIIEMSEMTLDEISVLDQFVGKYMREGRNEYGPLDLETDERSLYKIILEAADEGLDREFYLATARLKLNRLTESG